MDTSATLAYKRDESDVVSHLDASEPWFTSTICVYEFVNGAMWKDGISAHVARQSIGGVQSVEFSETIALEAARIQNELRRDGDEMAVRDLLVAATARSTGAELVVADDDFDTEHLAEQIDITDFSG